MKRVVLAIIACATGILVTGCSSSKVPVSQSPKPQIPIVYATEFGWMHSGEFADVERSLRDEALKIENCWFIGASFGENVKDSVRIYLKPTSLVARVYRGKYIGHEIPGGIWKSMDRPIPRYFDYVYVAPVSAASSLSLPSPVDMPIAAPKDITDMELVGIVDAIRSEQHMIPIKSINRESNDEVTVTLGWPDHPMNQLTLNDSDTLYVRKGTLGYEVIEKSTVMVRSPP